MRTSNAGEVGAAPLRRRDAEENHRRLLDAAAVVFARDGLDGSVEEVARTAKLGMGTLYRHFPTKAALVEALANDLYGELLAAGRAALDENDGSGLERLLRAIGAALAAKRGCMARLWVGAVPEAFVAQLDEIWGELLARAKAAGVVREECTLTDLSVVCWALRGVIETGGEIAPAVWQRHLDFVLAGLRPGAAPLSHPALPAKRRLEILASHPARAR
ncbi:MAG TPA: helix-turn-helix domain-containing protein [Acidimicrobiales bacterium]|nr:helix-turn-helix domain-containing protein [Acidimicrobiales bacterium]